jgi:hypothetical protein
VVGVLLNNSYGHLASKSETENGENWRDKRILHTRLIHKCDGME